MIYKLSIWQYRINIICTILFLILSIIWFITDCNRIEPLVVLFGGFAGLSSLIWPKPNYGSQRLKGRESFNYSSNNGQFKIGQGEMSFTTKWSKASDVSIYLYNDPENIEKIAIAKNVFNFSEIKNPDCFDFSSRAITLQENEIAILVNKQGFYCVLRIVDVKDNTYSDDRDELTIEWVINPEKQKDFS